MYVRGMGLNLFLLFECNTYVRHTVYKSISIGLVSVLKKKQIYNPSLRYRKAKELTVKLNGLTKKVLDSKVLRP